MWAIDPKVFAGIVGSTDTEVVFRLALTFGLEEDPIGALERTVGLIETTATERGVAPLAQGAFGVSGGSGLWAARDAPPGARRRAEGARDVRCLGRQQPVGRAVRDRGPGAVPLRVGRRRLAAPALSRKEDVDRDG